MCRGEKGEQGQREGLRVGSQTAQVWVRRSLKQVEDVGAGGVYESTGQPRPLGAPGHQGDPLLERGRSR